jgi:hypothetical protein
VQFHAAHADTQGEATDSATVDGAVVLVAEKKFTSIRC